MVGSSAYSLDQSCSDASNRGGTVVSLDPDVQRLLDLVAAADTGPLRQQPVDEVRAGYALLSQMGGGAGASDVQTEDRTIPGPDGGELPVRVYRPPAGDGDTPGIAVFFHGGGWVIGDLDSHDACCRDLASQSGALLVAVDYRRAPEHGFPAAADDAVAALRWVHEHAAELGGDPSRLAVVGDSAGGNLAAVVAVQARDDGGPALRLQLLAYPVTDSGMDTASYKENGDGYFLTAETMAWFWDQYVGEGNRSDPRVSVLQTADLAGVAPAVVLTAEFDPLRDEGEEYAQRLSDAGVATERRRYDGQIHGFLGFSALVPASAAIIAETAATLRQALA
jgi:acetyl esterase